MVAEVARPGAIGSGPPSRLRGIEPRRRQHVFAQHGDTIATLAARLLPGDQQGERKLGSWNLHLMLRRDGAPLLGSDIVYVEPPLP